MIHRADFSETTPNNINMVLLHCCCAPCSTAIVEWMLSHNITPVLFFYNPNIFPFEEYFKRKEECLRYANNQNIKCIDADYNHDEWLYSVKGLEKCLERGERCYACFKQRMLKTALFASENNYKVIATTLASSRWKNLSQVSEAGRYAVSQVQNVIFWDQNWRRNGLQERRNQLIRQYNLYNQLYCGCEFSLQMARFS